MHLRISMICIWIIWQSFGLLRCSNLHELEYDLEVKNLSLRITNKEAFLTWDCDVSMENFSDISYEILSNTFYEDWEFLADAKGCSEEIQVTLPNDLPSPVCFKVVPVLNPEKPQNASEICLNPGRNEMTENIQCFVYNTSSMKCTWTFGKNVSYDGNCTVYLKQDATIKTCQQYVNDLEMRKGSCSFHDLTIQYFKDTAIILNTNGSELKYVFKPAEREIFNPPTNITVRHSNENVILSWRGPDTQYPAPDSCFQYQVEKNKELISDVSNPQSILNLEKECVIRLRAKGEPICGMNTNWGQWSGEILCESPQKQPDKTELIILIILMGLSGFIILLTIIISIKYKRIVKSLFPRIPQPKNYLDDTQDDKTNTKIYLMPFILSTSETEEYISLQKNNS